MSSAPFERGDTVKCINNTGVKQQLTVGREYAVTRVFLGQSPEFDRVKVVCDDGWPHQMLASRFTKAANA